MVTQKIKRSIFKPQKTIPFTELPLSSHQYYNNSIKNQQSKKMLSFSIPILLTLLTCLRTTTEQNPQQCGTNTKLTNFFQIDRKLEIGSGTNFSNSDEINWSYALPYSGAYFDTRPIGILSIRDHNCGNFSRLDYRTVVEVGETSIRVVFTSKGMRWMSVGVVVWVTARPDLYVGNIVGQNFKQGTPTLITVNTTKPMPFFSDKQTISLNFINSITAISSPTSPNYQLSCTTASLNQTTYTVQITTAPETTLSYIKISYIIYNLGLTLIASDGGFLSTTLVPETPIFIKMHNNFAPILYWFVGFDSITVRSQGKYSFGWRLDQDFVLEARAGDRIENVKFLYVGIGQKMTDICANCTHNGSNSIFYAYGANCVTQCPTQTYPYSSYIKGGHSCLTCLSKLHQILNPNKTGCDCMEGFVKNSANGCQPVVKIQLTGPVATAVPVIANITNGTRIVAGAGVATISTTTTTSSTSTVLTNSSSGVNTSTTAKFNNQTTNNASISNSGPTINSQRDNAVPLTIPNNPSVIKILNTTTTTTTTLTSNTTTSNTNINRTTNITKNTSTNTTPAINITRLSTSPVSSINISPMITHSVSQLATLSAEQIALPKCTPPKVYNISSKKCECDQFSIPDDAGCFRCFQGSFPGAGQCNPCGIFCLNCRNDSSCEKCQNGYVFDKVSKNCVPGASGAGTGGFDSFGGGPSFGGGFGGSSDSGFSSDGSFGTPTPTPNTSTPPASSTTCKESQILFNGSCICNHRSIEFNDQCIECPPPTYKDQVTKNCMLCADVIPFCDTCDNASVCLTCLEGRRVDGGGKCVVGAAANTTTTTTSTTTTTPTTPVIVNTTTTTVVINTTTTTTTPITIPVTPPSTNTTGVTTVNANRTNQTSSTLSVKCKQNEILLNNACICDSLSVNFGGTCIQCPPSTFKDTEASCRPCEEVLVSCALCTNATVCLTCADNLQFDGKTGKCACLPPFHLLDTGCIECPPGFVFDERQKTCINPALNPIPTPIPTNTTTNTTINTNIKCQQNQISVGSLCICDNFSVDFGGNCIRCPDTTFKDLTDNYCRPCVEVMPDCRNCQSATKCTLCEGNLRPDGMGKCTCLPPFHLLDTGCIECPPGFVFDERQKNCINPALTPKPTTNTTNTTKPPTCTQNQIFLNNLCICNNRSVDFNGGCTPCPPQTFKDVDMNFCMPCQNTDPNCNTCVNASYCLTCVGNFKIESGRCKCLPPFWELPAGCLQCPPNFTYDPQQKTCIKPAIIVPNITTNNTRPTNQTNQSITPLLNCKPNQIFSNTSNTCICNNISINTTGTCQPCPSGSYKFVQVCAPCIDNCVECASFTQCTRCLERYTYNGFDRVCEPVCGVGEILANGQCLCDQFSGRNPQNICQKCPPSTTKVQQRCLPCPGSCLECTTPQKCTKCSNNLALNTATFQCCGVNQRYNGGTRMCECVGGMRNISGVCGICPEGLVYVEVTRLCVLASTVIPPPSNNNTSTNTNNTTPITCPPGQTLQSGGCTCPDAHFPAQAACLPCLANCLNCTNSDSCDICNGNYTGRACQFCAQGFFLTGGIFGPQRCERDQCGNGATSNREECDDGNVNSGDGCSSKCLVQNGYICRTTTCTRIIIKTIQKITSTGLFLEYTYPQSQSQPTPIATNANLLSLSIINGTSPSSSAIKIIRPVNNPRIVRVLFDYCGLLPEQNVTVEFISGSKLGNVRYVSQYNLAARVVIGRNSVTKSLKEEQEILT